MSDATAEAAAFITRFVVSRAPQGARELDDGIDLFAAGLLDSLGLLEMVSAIEQRFNVTIDFSELDLDQLSRVDDWAALVGRSTQTRPGAPP